MPVITNVTNTSPVVVTSAAHGLTTGTKVRITGITGTSAANGDWTVTNLTADTFSLDTSVGNGNHTGGGVWTRYTLAITGATNANPIVITSTAHSLSTGDRVSIRDVAGNTNANGVYLITLDGADRFSLNGRAGNAAYTSGGTWTLDTNLTSFLPPMSVPDLYAFARRQTRPELYRISQRDWFAV